MSVLLSNPPVAPEEYINTLEYYISSNFEDAKTYQFITEISAIELISVSEIQNNVSLLLRVINKYVEVSQKYRKILRGIQEISIKDIAKSSTDEEEKTRILETVTRLTDSIILFWRTTNEICDLLGEITNKYWNYLPNDFQDLIEDYVYSSLQHSERFFNVILEQINEHEKEPVAEISQFFLQIPHKIDFILDGIEQNSLKLQSRFPEIEDPLESPRDSLQRAWGEFLEGKMLAISELGDEIASE